ncbi:FxDxF family PEP-CTERM protein [Massilia sp. METH4]|uniref:FxDxF family PEP-CTERM protein n=1 Tax=Massilia sp. METH4 TaxID=3123041 RepID=UPI0030D1756C
MKLKFAVASVLAAASMSAFADNQNLTASLDAATEFDSVGTLFADNGADVLTFGGLAPGLYDIVITVSGQQLNFNAAATTLNGVTGAYDASVGKFKFLGFEATASSPFVLNLAGWTTGAKAVYSGELTVSAVPEPSTYGMLLGGLGIMGFLARRKSKQA